MRFIPFNRNCVVGKLHQRVELYQNSYICQSRADFEKVVDNHNFVDFHYLGPQSCVVLSDGKIITNHQNVPSISAKVRRKTNK